MIAIAILAYLWAFWAFYILVMGIYRAHMSGRLTGLNKVLAVPFVVIGYLMDVLANLVIAPFLFMDFPREWLVTDRLQRYKSQHFGWRYDIADYICEHILDPFDPTGNHC